MILTHSTWHCRQRLADSLSDWQLVLVATYCRVRLYRSERLHAVLLQHSTSTVLVVL